MPPRRLSPTGRDRLVECIQYLNLDEMRELCQRHGLPLYIHLRKPDGTLKRSPDRDRKDVVLQRILGLALDGRRRGPTVYERDVIGDGPLPARLTARTRIRYGQYEKKNAHFLETMERLTGGAFRTGMIARLVLRDFWTGGEAPTLGAFARAWIAATEAHRRPRPEGAYLVDLWRGEAGPGWKERRVERAREALAMLARLLAGESGGKQPK